MDRKAGIIFVAVGVVLMLSALLLFGYNRYEEYSAGQEAEVLLENIQGMIIEREDVDTPTVNDVLQKGVGTGELAEATDEAEEKPVDGDNTGELAVVNIDGYDYIGYLSIPALDLELPVMADWDYKRLKTSPCRQCGSSETDDLVIAAHNYKTHFGSLAKLEIGSAVYFTDMEGLEYYFQLERLETMAPDDVEAVIDSDYDLVLYTCTPGGKSRVVAFCNRVIDE